jgi:cupin 2 domain-containing protein
MKKKPFAQNEIRENESENFTNFLSHIPEKIDNEIFQDIVRSEQLTIERIISHGQSSPETGWYDQEKSEWVMVLEGEAILEFEDGRETSLGKHDFLLILPHQKHRVKWTSPEKKTVWLAVHF